MALYDKAGTATTASQLTVVLTPSLGAPPNGSVIVITVCMGSNNPGTVTSPGFSAISGAGALTFTTSGGRFYSLYKVAGASEPTSYTVTSSSVANWQSAQIWVFTGRNTAAPFTFAQSTTGGAATTSPLSVALVGGTAAAGDDLLWVAGLGGGGPQNVAVSLTPPTNFASTLVTGQGGSFSPTALGCVRQNVGAGATGTETGSASWTGGGTADWGGYVISLAASASGWVPKAYGTPVGGYGTPYSLSPTIPGSPSVGDILLMQTGVQMGDHTQPTISGWTNLTPSSTAGQRTQCLYGRVYTGSGDTPSAFNWSLSAVAYAMIHVYSGGTLTISGGVGSGNFNNSGTNGISYPSATISDPNCLVIAFGCKDTTQASAAFGAFGSFTVQQTFFSSSSISAVYNDWIQTTATGISSGTQTISPSDGAGQNNAGWIIALLPYAQIPVSAPPVGPMPRQIYIMP